MKNRRILTKILLLVLTLATVIGAFAISGSAKVDATKTLVEGIDFDGLAAAEPSSTTRDNIYNETGLYFDTNANVAVQETPGDEGNMRLYFNNGANYIRPTFKKNDALLELLFTENGPKTFKLELDLAINNAFAGTAEANDAKKNAITTQRGFSVLNIGTNWLFKATAPGAGTVNVKEGVTVNDKGVVTEGGKYLYVESVNPGTENVGYFYKDAKNYYFPASAKMGWADAKYTGSTEGAISEGGKTYVAGYANVAASNAALQAVSYTVGVPQHFVLSFTRTEVAGDNNDTMNVQVHVDGKLLVSSSTYTLNATNYKDGFRITDISGVGVSIDNFKVVLPTEDNNCQSGAHTSVDGWADTKVEFENAGDNAGVIYKVVCKDCGEIVNTDIYPNVIKTYGDIVGKTSAQFLEGFRSDVWNNYKNSPFWLSFDWTVNQLPTTNESILAWRGNTKNGDVKNDVYVWPLRLWEDGTVKMRVQNPAEAYVNFATPFKVSVGNTYRIDVRFDLAHSTFDVFADGVYLDTGYHSRLSSTNKEVGAYPMIRFIGGSTGKHDFTNIVITKGVTPENHKHNTSLNDEFDNGVLVDKTTIATSYTCYCGEIVSNGDAITKLHVDNLVDSYEGSAVIEGLPTEGEYWIAFDYNVRNASAVSGSGVVIAKLGDTIIEDTHAAVPEVTTVNYAINVKYDEYGKLSYDVYENGVYSNGGSDITVEGDASVLTLGDSRVNDVRFNYVKVAEVSKGTAVVPNFTDNELRPCYHSNYAEKAVAIKLIDGSYYKTALCTECGERLDVKLVDKFDPNIQTKEDVKDRNFALGAGVVVNVYDSVKLTSAEYPYFISFDVTVDSFDIAAMAAQSDTATAGRNLFSTNKNFANILRMFLIEDESTASGYAEDRVTLRTNKSTTADVVIEEMYKNETYRIVLAITPNTGKVDIYVNGEFAASRTIKITSSDDNFRFFEGPSWGTGTVENFSVAQNTTVETHTHTDKWCYMSEKGVEMTDDTFEPYYYCYCGEKVSYGTVNEIVVNNIPVVYKGTAPVQAESLEGTWFTTDINIRDLEAGNGNLVKIGDTTVLQFMDGAIAYGTGGNAAIVDHVNTYSVAINFRADNRYDIYIDGKLCSVNHSYEGDSIITLGDEAFGENVRFYCNRLVKVGEGTELKPVYDIDETVRPHYHANATTLYDIKIVVGNGVVYKSAICGDCGEKAKIGLNNLLTEDNGPGWVNNTLLNGESITFSNYKGIRVSPDIIGSKGIPYIVEFDLDVDVINENTIRFDGANVRKNGRILFGTYADASATVSNNYFQHFLRLFVVPDETTADANDYIDGKAYLRIGESEDKSPLVTTIEEGHSYHFAMYVDPVNRKITVNSWDLNDESTFSVTNGTINNIGTQRSDYRFRFLDGGWGTFTVNQFAFYNNDTSGDVFHTHSDEWLTNDENTNTTIIRTKDHKLAYSYECYCGQTVTYGISEVIKESVMPVYGITDETVIIPKFEAPEKDFWLLGEISIMELPEESKSLVAIGDGVLLGITPDGVLTVGDEETNAKLTVDNEYHKLAFRFDTTLKKYTVYLDNSVVAESEYTAVGGDVKVAAAGAGKYHFDRAAVVALSKEGNMAYKLAEGAHTHHYDPETSSLEFNAERSSITINYTCVECDRPAFDGISENLYDADNSQMILPVFGTEEKVVEGELLTSAAPYWFSFDAVLKSELAQGRGSVFKFVDEENNEISILTMYTDGALFDAEGNEIARLGKTKTNVTVNVIENEGEYSYRLYIDGVYLGEYELALDGEKSYAIALGAEFATTLEATEIKFAKMANGGTLKIGTFVCANDEHVNVINTNTRVEYLDVNAFSFTYRCVRCGKTVTEQINKSFYEATPHVYTAQGALNAGASEEKGDSYWIVADVNVRGYLGGFRSFVPLISDGEVAALLINSEGELMLADGTKVYRALKSKSTYNVALKYEDGVYYLFLDGAYAGCTTGTSFKQGITHGSSNEYFGSPELNNIRYYNIKVVTTGVTDEPVRVQFIEDASVLPCVHSHHSFLDVVITLGEQIKEVYICDKCGERVLRVNNKDILNSTSNAFIENGSFTASGSKFISSEEKYLSVEAAPYWVRFTVEFTDFASPEHINSANKGKGRQNGVTLFGTKSGNAYGHILIMVTPEIGVDKFADGVVEIRGGGNRNAPLITTVYEGDIHEFVIGVVPSSGKTVIYMDGEFVFERNTPIYKTGRSDYGFRFLDHTSGTFNVTNFEFVTAGGHTHTAKYAQYIDGGYDVLAYTESTLTHRYTCYCGAEIEEGIDRIYVDPITKVDGATDFTAINDGEEITMGADPYWFSAKVFTKGTAANIFSYGEDERMVEIKTPDVAEGEEEQPIMFFVDGVATYVEPSANGDYDVISVMVNPVTGEYDVYVNGSYLASGNAGFVPNEKFNILLGGAGSDVAYSNLKLVGLKDGATGEVANCGDHSFKNSGMVIKYVATEGKITSLTYVCSFCGEEVIRTVTPDPDTVVYRTGMNTGGNRVVIRSEPKTTEGSDEIKYDTDNFDKLVDMNYEGSRWLTFEAKPIDLKIKEGKNNAFVCWVYDYNHGLPVDPATGKTPDGTAYSRFFRAYYVDDKTVEVRITRGGTNHVAAIGSPTMTEGKTYKFAIEYFTSTGVYYAYMSEADSDVLKFIGEGKLDAFDYSVKGNPNKDGAGKNEEYGIRFGDGNIGNVTISNVNVFNGTVADRPVEDTSIEIKSHFPADNAPGTMSYVDGQIYHEFVCGCGCNKTIKNTVLNSLQNPALNGNKVVTEVLNISSPKKLYVDKELITNGGTPFYLAFELTPDKINTDDIKRKTEKNKNGASILALLGETAGTDAIQVDLLRACYRNGRVVLDCPLDTGNEFELEIVEGETYNFVFAINPTTGRIICSVKGTTIDYNKVSKLDTSKENYSIRFLYNHEGVWGQYDFTNIKFGYMVDECAHKGKTCVEAGGKKTYICYDCGNTAFAAHNYISVVDSTGKWTLYKCEDCKEVFVVFNDVSLIADLEFATYDELMEYLVMEYPPMFIRIME